MTRETDDPERPLLLTLACVLGWAVVAISLARIAADPEGLARLPLGHQAAGVTPPLALGVALVGYWRMRRWGPWLVAALLGARVLLGLTTEAFPLRLTAVAVPAALLVLALPYLGRME